MKFITLALAVACLASLTGYGQQAITQTLNTSNSRESMRVFCNQSDMADQSFLESMVCNFNRSKQTFYSFSNSTSTSEEQTTAIEINSVNLRQPHTIEITSDSGTSIVGYIALDGKVLKTFSGNNASMNLSPFLSKGKRTIVIAGNYRPVDASVSVELTGPGTSVSQSTGGSGKIKQTLVIYVH